MIFYYCSSNDDATICGMTICNTLIPTAFAYIVFVVAFTFSPFPQLRAQFKLCSHIFPYPKRGYYNYVRTLNVHKYMFLWDEKKDFINFFKCVYFLPLVFWIWNSVCLKTQKTSTSELWVFFKLIYIAIYKNKYKNKEKVIYYCSVKLIRQFLYIFIYFIFLFFSVFIRTLCYLQFFYFILLATLKDFRVFV